MSVWSESLRALEKNEAVPGYEVERFEENRAEEDRLLCLGGTREPSACGLA